jgi:starch synthase
MPAPITTAIYYHPEGYSTSGPQLMGRNAAGESFLRGFLTYSSGQEFWVQVQAAEHARLFAASAHLCQRPEPIKAVHAGTLGYLAQVGQVYIPGPDIGTQAWHRASYGHGAWSLCGITHTTASARVMDALAELLTAPVQPWDAIICTSQAVKANLEHIVAAQTEYLRHRLGISTVVLPQLPVIPLGIHSGDFVFSSAQRASERAGLGIAEESLVVLFIGRLSYHAKAHPLAMYQAAEQVARSSGKQLVLIECGWHANDSIREAFAEAAQLACPSVQVIQLDGRSAEGRQAAWASADIFCSLVDNLQETFGITPLEAMAAGLPVLVSDWDGYKETVREGVDGFRIASIMPGDGLGRDLAQRHALGIDSYDRYCGYTSSLVAIDVVAATAALRRLVESPELRQRMGAAGRARVRAHYDWSGIIPRYEALWRDLAAIRKSRGATLAPLPQPWPARPDPFSAFASYPSRRLSPETRLALVDADSATAQRRYQQYRALKAVEFMREPLVVSDGVLLEMLAAAAVGPVPARELVQHLAAEEQPVAFRSLLWLLKLGLLRVC